VTEGFNFNPSVTLTFGIRLPLRRHASADAVCSLSIRANS